MKHLLLLQIFAVFSTVAAAGPVWADFNDQAPAPVTYEQSIRDCQSKIKRIESIAFRKLASFGAVVAEIQGAACDMDAPDGLVTLKPTARLTAPGDWLVRVRLKNGRVEKEVVGAWDLNAGKCRGRTPAECSLDRDAR